MSIIEEEEVPSYKNDLEWIRKFLYENKRVEKGRSDG